MSSQYFSLTFVLGLLSILTGGILQAVAFDAVEEKERKARKENLFYSSRRGKKGRERKKERPRSGEGFDFF